MPIRNFPFSRDNGGIARPYLRIRISNPHTGLSAKTYGLIDTGADECAIPAGYSAILGHNLERGTTKQISTGNGITAAYAHSTRFEIFHPETEDVIYTIDNTPLDFMPNLNVVLLGVNSFLSRFVLEINYPEKRFTVKWP